MLDTHLQLKYFRTGHTDVNIRDIDMDGESEYDLTEEEDRNAFTCYVNSLSLSVMELQR